MDMEKVALYGGAAIAVLMGAYMLYQYGQGQGAAAQSAADQSSTAGYTDAGSTVGYDPYSTYGASGGGTSSITGAAPTTATDTSYLSGLLDAQNLQTQDTYNLGLAQNQTNLTLGQLSIAAQQAIGLAGNTTTQDVALTDLAGSLNNSFQNLTVTSKHGTVNPTTRLTGVVGVSGGPQVTYDVSRLIGNGPNSPYNTPVTQVTPVVTPQGTLQFQNNPAG